MLLYLLQLLFIVDPLFLLFSSSSSHGNYMTRVTKISSVHKEVNSALLANLRFLLSVNYLFPLVSKLITYS